MPRSIEPPLISVALSPGSDADRDALSGALRTLSGEDPSLSVTSDPATGDPVIGGTSEPHLEDVLERLRREFDLVLRVGPPRVVYKEAFTRAAEGEAKYVRQTGGRGHYAHVKIRLHPGEPGTGCVFANVVVGGSIPDAFVEPVHRGISDALATGVVAGWPVEDVRVELYDGSYHDVDSSDDAFRMAGLLAFMDAARKASPVLLEPIVRIEVLVPLEHAKDVAANLSARRADIRSWEDRSHGTQCIVADVPLAEMFGYRHDLHTRTSGRGAFSMAFERYQVCRPPDDEPGSRDSYIGAPRKPRPNPRTLRTAVPEPEPDDLEDGRAPQR